VILHTFNKAQSHTELNQQLTNTCSSNDSVLLIEDAVYQLLDPTIFTTKDHWSFNAKNIFALANDATARGINQTEFKNDKIRFISYPEFVELTASHTKTISWY
jgi:sulfur relay protein TusB/DsrH